MHDTTLDGMTGLQIKFQSLNAKVNQMRSRDRRTSSMHKPESLQSAQKFTSKYFWMYTYLQ